MVLEIGRIHVQAGREDDFVAAYHQARELLERTDGCRSVRMTRGVEAPTEFVLLVEWDSVEAHIENFRNSDRFPRWRGLIAPFFDGDPIVAHWADV
ncbi:MAG: antibiotic biosynthesis monooxygenase [Actinomycetota bacterium]|nr:antibiotic biosynthesis monooxygenase [Actinomycetota bacterium]